MTLTRNIASTHLILATTEIENLRLTLSCGLRESRNDAQHPDAILNRTHAALMKALKQAENKLYSQALASIRAALEEYYELPANMVPVPESIIAAKHTIELAIKGQLEPLVCR